MRLIDADALMGKSHMFTCNCDDDECEFEYIGVRDVINAHTIDAAPVVHARWVHRCRYIATEIWEWRCSACGEIPPGPNQIAYELRYCPWCGAKMDGGNENDGV